MKIGNSILAALILLFVTHSAHALDPSQPMKNYIQTRFSTDNGLSTNIINGIVQSRDELLWVHLGTLSLARFDGQRFADLPFEHVTAMTIGLNGDLWIVSRSTLNFFGRHR